MFLMYVDESGDCGALPGSPSSHFVLVGLVVHELRWQKYLDQLVAFRRRMRKASGLKLREELHAAKMLSKPGPLKRIPKHDRLAIIRALANELSTMSELNLIPVVVSKKGKPSGYDVFDMAWRALVQRLENTIGCRNFAGAANADDKGIVLPDHTDDAKLTALVRRMRRFNPVPNQPQCGGGYRDLRLANIVEDPCFKDSRHSLFVQAVDLAAFLLYQQECPNAFMRKKGGCRYFRRLQGIVCKAVSPRDPQGIVRL